MGKTSKDREHFIVSTIKSVLRIGGCTIALLNINNIDISIAYLSISFLIAEILGILEEVVDKRK